MHEFINKMNNNPEYRIETAKDGNPVIIVMMDGKEIPLHSRINPLKENDTAGYIFNPGKFNFLIVLGCGLGYSIFTLKEYASKFSRIIIIDILPDIETEIEKNPFTSFLSKEENISFFTGMNTGEIENALARIINLDELKGIQIIEHLQSARIFPAYYYEVNSLIKKIIDKKASDKATRNVFGNLFLRNALNNLAAFNNYCPVKSLAGKFKGRKAVIVSSAPSAGDNIADLKYYGNDIYIIAVDSALPLLRCHSINPDFVISIDPQPRIGEHFLGHDFPGAYHIFSIVSPPELVEKYGGFISLNSHPVAQIIDDMYPGINGSVDSATGSVAGDAFMFAFTAGFEYIAMTGFDFSFSENIIYARGTAYQTRYTEYFNNRFRTPETFNGAYIFKSSGSLTLDGKYTRRSFINYRNSLDSLIKEKKFKNIFFINKRGLPLTGANKTDFETFMKIPSPIKENKCEFLSTLNVDKKSGTIDIENVKRTLLKEKVLDAVLEESLGNEFTHERRKKIISLIEKI